MTREIYEWVNYIQGPRWVDLKEFVEIYALRYDCKLENWDSRKSFLSQIAFFTISGTEPNLTELQDDIMTNPNVRVK